MADGCWLPNPILSKRARHARRILSKEPECLKVADIYCTLISPYFVLCNYPAQRLHACGRGARQGAPPPNSSAAPAAPPQAPPAPAPTFQPMRRVMRPAQPQWGSTGSGDTSSSSSTPMSQQPTAAPPPSDVSSGAIGSSMQQQDSVAHTKHQAVEVGRAACSMGTA